jgi:hypothetical protein
MGLEVPVMKKGTRELAVVTAGASIRIDHQHLAHGMPPSLKIYGPPHKESRQESPSPVVYFCYF